MGHESVEVLLALLMDSQVVVAQEDLQHLVCKRNIKLLSWGYINCKRTHHRTRTASEDYEDTHRSLYHPA